MEATAITVAKKERQKQKGPSVFPVSNVASKCIEGETVARNIAVNHAASLPTVNGSESVNAQQPNKGVHGDMVTQHEGGSAHWYDPKGRKVRCQQCGKEYVAKRSSSRFCSGRCRTAAYRERLGKS